MNTCKTCRWWVKAAHWTEPDGYAECTHPKICEPWGYERDNPTATDCLVYDYDEGGGFSTGPDFGCVHHAPREVAGD